MAEKDKKKKKEKITYIDDGRTIADMSGLYQNRKFSSRGTTSPVSEIWKTYWNAVRMMFVPMLATIAALGIIYLIVLVIFSIL